MAQWKSKRVKAAILMSEYAAGYASVLDNPCWRGDELRAFYRELLLAYAEDQPEEREAWIDGALEACTAVFRMEQCNG